MNYDFPRILTLLRKERGYSQKQAASDLGISQALLSHYEKGIRECGLAFVVKASDYYNVSADYLLGRTPHRSGATLTVDDLSEAPEAPAEDIGDSTAEYNRRIVCNSLNIVFSMLQKINSENLTRETSLYLSAPVYKIFRVLYSANRKNPQGLFELDRRLFGATIESCLAMSEAKSRYILGGESVDGNPGVKKESLLSVTPDSLLKEFPSCAPALFDLIKNVESAAKSDK